MAVVVDDSVVETLTERLDEVGIEEDWVFWCRSVQHSVMLTLALATAVDGRSVALQQLTVLTADVLLFSRCSPCRLFLILFFSRQFNVQYRALESGS